MLLDKPRTNRVTNAENVEAVTPSVRNNVYVSFRCRSKQLDLIFLSSWRILLKDLGLHPYKIQLI